MLKKISEIKPDKEQPRKTFEDESLKFLSESILSNGLITPIDIDEDGMIIDGERRWRAHKIAGLKEIEVRVVKLNKDKGFWEFTPEDFQLEGYSPHSNWKNVPVAI